jgi:heme exporter protein A
MAGKTTLLRLIAGIAEPMPGILLARRRRGAGAVVQCHFIADRDAAKPIRRLPRICVSGAIFSAQAIPMWRSRAGLAPLATLQAVVLSAGQRRRLALSRPALVHRPLWLLDEPTVGLDAPSRDRLVALLAARAGRGGIVVAATHGGLGIEGIDIMPGGARRSRRSRNDGGPRGDRARPGSPCARRRAGTALASS